MLGMIVALALTMLHFKYSGSNMGMVQTDFRCGMSNILHRASFKDVEDDTVNRIRQETLDFLHNFLRCGYQGESNTPASVPVPLHQSSALLRWRPADKAGYWYWCKGDDFMQLIGDSCVSVIIDGNYFIEDTG